ncbi:serralysin [Gammaproteobacteria bacterium]
MIQAQVGKYVHAVANYTDQQGTVESVASAATTTVANINDVPTGGVTIRGTATQGQILTATNTLADTDGLGTIHYQWQVSTNGSSSWTNIAGATANIFTLTQAQVGKYVHVVANYTDGQGTHEIVSSGNTTVVTRGEIRHGSTGSDHLDGGQGDDILYGDAGNDTLTGGAGQDTLYGGNGNDVLDGSSNADSMDGGNGADIYYVDNALDIAQDSGTDGVGDIVHVTSFLASGYTLGAGIDNGILDAQANNTALTGNTGNNILTGNASDNILSGGDGADTINGGGGNDTLYDGNGNDSVNGGDGNDWIIAGSGTGNDHYSGGAGIDTVNYIAALVALNLNLATGQVSGGGIGADTLTLIENAIGGGNNDILTGSTGANLLDGYTGNDRLSGGDGNDTLIGGVGHDTLLGGSGRDSFDFNSLSELGTSSGNWDIISDFTRGQDKIDLSTLDANTATATNDSFTGFIGGNVGFSLAGQLKFVSGILYGNTDTDNAAEFAIQLTGITSLTASDLVL